MTQPFDEIEQVNRAIDDYRHMRDAAGPDVALMCDAAGVYSPTAAARLIEGLREVDIYFVEEPTNQDTVNPTLQLKRAYPDVKIAVERTALHPLGLPGVVREPGHRRLPGGHLSHGRGSASS